MTPRHYRASSNLWRKIAWILSLAAFSLICAIGYVGATGTLDFNMIAPTVAAVACAAALVCGIVVFAFLSDQRRDT